MRDGRGTPGRYVPPRHQPKLRLGDVLRRRKTSLRAFMDTLGISTYEALVIRCDRLGVQPPTLDEFHVVFPYVPRANSAQEGVVVLEPLEPVERAADANDVLLTSLDQSEEPTGASLKRSRRKKDVLPID